LSVLCKKPHPLVRDEVWDQSSLSELVQSIARPNHIIHEADN
jgi:hypothetical protein